MRELRNDSPRHAIVADIGGTNARFAIANLETLALSHVSRISCGDHPSLTEAAIAYRAELQQAIGLEAGEGLHQPPRFAAFAVAAPVTGETISFTNSPWHFSRSAVCRDLDLEGLLVLNDFEALALSLPHLAAENLIKIGGGEPAERAAKVVLGPGTGLGAAGLVWSPSGWIAVPGEGGHATLAASHADQFALIEQLLTGLDHVSAERVVSGPGLSDLYRAVAAHRSGKPLADQPVLPPGEIVDRAMAASDPLAEEALSHFITWLGRFAGDAALFFGARGGVYLGGGVPAKILDLLRDGNFREAFEAKGRMRAFLAPIPLYVIGDDQAALRGAGAALRHALATGSTALSCA